MGKLYINCRNGLAGQENEVNKGSKLSLQMHHHRAEHWIVVKGTAEVK